MIPQRSGSSQVPPIQVSPTVSAMIPNAQIAVPTTYVAPGSTAAAARDPAPHEPERKAAGRDRSQERGRPVAGHELEEDRRGGTGSAVAP